MSLPVGSGCHVRSAGVRSPHHQGSALSGQLLRRSSFTRALPPAGGPHGHRVQRRPSAYRRPGPADARSRLRHVTPLRRSAVFVSEQRTCQPLTGRRKAWTALAWGRVCSYLAGVQRDAAQAMKTGTVNR